MSHPKPPEIDLLNALLERVLVLKGDGSPTISALAAELCAAKEMDQSESVVALFQLMHSIDAYIDDAMAGNKTARAGVRLKARLAELLSPDVLARPYNEYQNSQRQNVQAILDLMSFLDHLEFDSEKFSLAIPQIEDALTKVEDSAAASEKLSDSQKKLVIAQVALIRRALIRFSVDGLGPFRDSIFTSIGRLTVELKSPDADQASAVRNVIDDLIRVKDVAELAGGALMLTGTVIAGYLSGPGAS